ncbi:hypothetical protein [Actinomadura harenae]|uniref:Uncharacterized protein n=1 Tax=Actinomadura harenae TaxID=2483351 RepID=A0A3M2M3A6_9ACTN|nr:hypothetical protein [Actinomadura harenae]RMI44036.1 hypothetical protein EBO15_14015 [Actinomadura harenae]
MSTLEDRYRRLLAGYPAAHRAVHEQEMLDVLMSAARPGQTRPSLADTVDLLKGAVRIRLRASIGGDGPSAWPGALAVAGFLAMLQLLSDGVRFVIDIPSMASLGERPSWSTPHTLAAHFGMGPYWLAWTVVAVLAWRGRRAAAARGACGVTGVQVVLALHGTFFDSSVFGSLAASMAGTALPLALLATASLVASPGPRHGMRLLGRVRVRTAAAMACVLAVASSNEGFALLFGYAPTSDKVSLERLSRDGADWNRLRFGVLLLVTVLVVAALAHGREGRRACALLTVAAVPALVLAASPFADKGLDDLINNSGGIDPWLSLAHGLIGFALTTLGVRLIELPAQARARRRERTPA